MIPSRIIPMDLNGQLPPDPKDLPAEAPPQLPGVHPSIRSRCWRSATEYSLHSEPPPGFVRRWMQWALFGWKWESVVVVVVPQQKPE